jgi:hypothetical protein
LVAEAFIESRRLESDHEDGGAAAPVVVSGAIGSQQQASQAAATVRILRRAERVSRVYQIVADVIGGVYIHDGLATTSERRKKRLPYGSYVQITEVITIEVEAATESIVGNNGNDNARSTRRRRGLVRGRLDAALGEGWISIREAGTSGKVFALQIEPATYMITAPSVSVTSGMTLDSARLQGVDGSIRAGECVDIVTLHHMPKQGDRVRGKLATGIGWITLLDGLNGRELACPFRRGVYCTIAKSTEITTSVRREVVGMRRLEAGQCLNITNTVYDAEDGCVRGNIKATSGGGYVSLMDKTDWRVHVQYLPLGAYQVQQAHGETLLSVHNSADGASTVSGGGSTRLKSVPAGSYVEVVQTTYIDKESIVRGRLLSGGWVNLLDTAAGIIYATPVPLGVYITTDESIVVETRPAVADTSASGDDGEQKGAATNGASEQHAANSDNQIARKLKKYAAFEVTECHFLKAQKTVRARLATGGFITLINAEGGRAKPIMVGAWHTTRDYSVVHRSVKIEKGAEVQRIPAETIVDIVETRYLERDGHIRGRLASGGWMSLVNVKENVGYAKQVERRRSLVSTSAVDSRYDTGT